MYFKSRNESAVYRYSIKTTIMQGKREVEEEWIRRFKVYYIGEHEENYRIQLISLRLDHQSTVAVKYLYFQKKIKSVFDDVRLYVSKQGRIKQVLNILAIQRKALQVKNELAVDHQGFYFDSYFEWFLSLFMRQENLIAYLEQYSMYGLYFNSFLWSADKDITTENREMPEYDIPNLYLQEHWQSGEGESFAMRGSFIASETEGEVKEYGQIYGTAFFDKESLVEVNLVGKVEVKQFEYNLLWIG